MVKYIRASRQHNLILYNVTCNSDSTHKHQSKVYSPMVKYIGASKQHDFNVYNLTCNSETTHIRQKIIPTLEREPQCTDQ